MRSKGFKVGCVILFITLILFSFTGNFVNAAINESYQSQINNSGDSDVNVEKKLKESVITNALGIFVYSIASLVEKLIGNVFTALSGSTDFPWADRIIFNAIPLLDVNFFNPSEGSFFNQNINGATEDTAIARIVRNTYFTILSICIAFLTIIVAIAAIKMAISTLATEKAKYKEAITKWVFSITLIFLMHNLMSFIFYLNESLVEVASQILINTMDEYDGTAIHKALTAQINQLTDDQIIDNFIAGNDGFGDLVENARNFIKSDEYKALAAHLIRRDGDYQDQVIGIASNDDTGERFMNFMKHYWKTISCQRFITSASGYNPVGNVAYTVSLALDEDELNEVKNKWSKYEGLSKNQIRLLYEQEEDYNLLQQWFTTEAQIYEQVMWWINNYKAAERLRAVAYEENGIWKVKGGISQEKLDIIGNMAYAFKESAYTYQTDDSGKATGWKASKISVTGALLYAIFVAQSILYFFSYIKRFFYIIVLAIIAPVIVLFDFLGKAIG